MRHWARDRYEAMGRAWTNRKPPTPPPSPRQIPAPASAQERNERADLFADLEDLRVFIGKCEADWRLNDQLDLAAKVWRDA